MRNQRTYYHEDDARVRVLVRARGRKTMLDDVLSTVAPTLSRMPIPSNTNKIDFSKTRARTKDRPASPLDIGPGATGPAGRCEARQGMGTDSAATAGRKSGRANAAPFILAGNEAGTDAREKVLKMVVSRARGTLARPCREKVDCMRRITDR
jgi:hypothetical protein